MGKFERHRPAASVGKAGDVRNVGVLWLRSVALNSRDVVRSDLLASFEFPCSYCFSCASNLLVETNLRRPIHGEKYLESMNHTPVREFPGGLAPGDLGLDELLESVFEKVRAELLI